MTLTAFTPPALKSVDLLLGDAAPAAISEVAPTQVGVVRWEPIAARLMASGTPVSEIASYVKKSEEEVLGFLGGRGREMVKGYVAERPARMARILEGAEVDVVLTLMKIAKHGKMESAQVSACKALLELAHDTKQQNPKSPEEVKRMTEARIARRLEKANL